MADTLIFAYPNAVADAFGQLTKARFMPNRSRIRRTLVNIVGCAVFDAKHSAPLPPPSPQCAPAQSHTAALIAPVDWSLHLRDIPVNVGDRTNVPARQVRNLIPTALCSASSFPRSGRNGAQISDINLDEGLIDTNRR